MDGGMAWYDLLQPQDALSEVQKGVDACAMAAETLQILRCGGAAPASSEKLLAEGEGLPGMPGMPMGKGGPMEATRHDQLWHHKQSGSIACGRRCQDAKMATDATCLFVPFNSKAFLP